MKPSSLPVQQRIALLVKALDGAEKTNKALATCPDGDAMVDILLGGFGQAGVGSDPSGSDGDAADSRLDLVQEQRSPGHRW